jgi:hypothetical protein
MNAADVFVPGDLSEEADEIIAALLAHGEQGIAVLPDGTLYLLDNVEVWEQGILNADLVPVSAEAGDTDGRGNEDV